MGITLRGFSYSVYVWIVRFTLFEKGLAFQTVEVNPFSESGHAAHPFGRVPVFEHDGFRVYETNAITRYIDRVFPDPPLQPLDTQERARIDQIISVADNYAYWPLVRQVSSHGYFNEAFKLSANQSELAAGLQAAPKVLGALEELIVQQGILKGRRISLADIHLAPMIYYLRLAPDGAKLLRECKILSKWWNEISVAPGLVESKPDLPLLE